MNRLVVVIWLAVVALVAVVTGCDRAPRYDSRLVAADSLMQPAPDSALALVEAVAPGSLKAEGDRAYRDLLLTQARYRCYITATSDSDINRALDYYRRHDGEREKLTRAFIYKGTVMEELGHPDSAMSYYKTAEATAAPDDYFNLGYVNMRMGALYRNNHAMDGNDVIKYQVALNYLRQAEEPNYLVLCLINLGSLQCLKNPSEADSLLTEAVLLAEQLADTTYYIIAAQNLIKYDISQSRYDHARALTQRVMSLEAPTINAPFYLYAAYAYAQSNLPDSAQLLLDAINESALDNTIDRIALLEARSAIAAVRGDKDRSKALKEECNRLSDSIQSLDAPLVIIKNEKKMDERLKNQALKSTNESKNWTFKLILVSILIAVLSAVVLFVRRKKHDKIIIGLNQLLQESTSQLDQTRLSLEELNKLNVKETKLREFLESYMSLMRDLMEECYRDPKIKPTGRIRKAIKFQNNNRDKWQKLFGYIDIEFNNIITVTKDRYPQIDDRDLLLISLTALKFSYIQMSLVLGYANATTIGSSKQRLAKKMGLDCSLNEYIDSFKKS